MKVTPAISVQGLTKRYQLYDRPIDRLLQMAFRGRRTFYRDFWALHGLSFEVEPGRTVGVIGRNGSGKSTLLQILAGTLAPTEGHARVNGRVSALLELGAGFNPEFTGRENVLLSGAIMGIPRAEMERRFDAISHFAEIGDFIDQPVKTYSSGMYVRLAFATAIHVDPDVLLVDEALAVGDAVFQYRCIRRIKEMQAQGVTILFVSHDLSAVKALCDHAILLDGGRLVGQGDPYAIINQYQALVMAAEKADRTNVRETIPAGPGQAGLDGHGKSKTGPAGTKPVGEGAGAPEALRAADASGAADASAPSGPPEPGMAGLAAGVGAPPIPGSALGGSFRHGNGDARIADVAVLAPSGGRLEVVDSGSEMIVRVRAQVLRAVANPVIGIMVRNRLGIDLYGTNTDLMGCPLPPAEPGSDLEATFHLSCHLGGGDYAITVAIHTADGSSCDWIDDAVFFKVLGSRDCEGLVNMHGRATAVGLPAALTPNHHGTR